MTRSEFKKAQNNESIKEDNNPAFAFDGISSHLLSELAKGNINGQELAKRVLETRGQDINGNWAGFNHQID